MTHPFRIQSAPDVPAPPEDLPAREDTPGATAEDVAAQAAQARADAQAEEARERARARTKAREAGYAEGLEQGRSEARSALEAALGPAVEQLESGLAALQAERVAESEAMLRAAIGLGQSLAEHLVGAPRPFDRADLLREVLDEARAEATDHPVRLICRAAPSTLSEIAQALPATLDPVADPAMQPGGFVVELRDPRERETLKRWDASVERMQRVIRDLSPGIEHGDPQ
ncbi:hypothetical protein FGG78_19005 [Thioclava sp. BHET1]|nr:hypothetical protein FGG78_19005 [Thioclava sp. BHET1]